MLRLSLEPFIAFSVVVGFIATGGGYLYQQLLLGRGDSGAKLYRDVLRKGIQQASVGFQQSSERATPYSGSEAFNKYRQNSAGIWRMNEQCLGLF